MLLGRIKFFLVTIIFLFACGLISCGDDTETKTYLDKGVSTSDKGSTSDKSTTTSDKGATSDKSTTTYDKGAVDEGTPPDVANQQDGGCM